MALRTLQSIPVAIWIGSAAAMLVGWGCSPSLDPTNQESPGDLSSADVTDVPQEVVLRDGDEISGAVSARIIRVPSGAIVRVVDDANLHALESFVVEGELRVADVDPGSGRVDAPDLTLESDHGLAILGTVQGGRGRSFAGVDPVECLGLRGGDGSSITIESPDLLIAGVVRGGNGGQGGGGADGGHGGNIVKIGKAATSHGLSDAELDAIGSRTVLIGGKGGLGGPGAGSMPDGGDGGAGGAVQDDPHPDQVGPPVARACMSGHDGHKPGAAEGGPGNGGGPGNDGTLEAPNGGNGGDGGDGGSVTGSGGSKGQNGANCCHGNPGTGGDGGNGGEGGDAKGGTAGKGGKGGNAYPGSGGSGGSGGNAGNGGSAKSGDGGDGGDAGDGNPPGTPGNAATPGNSEAQAAGEPGEAGKPGGHAGDAGTSGSATGGSYGDYGDFGETCP